MLGIYDNNKVNELRTSDSAEIPIYFSVKISKYEPVFDKSVIINIITTRKTEYPFNMGI